MHFVGILWGSVLLFSSFKALRQLQRRRKSPPKKTLVIVCVYYYRPIYIENFSRVCMRTWMCVNEHNVNALNFRPCFIASLSLCTFVSIFVLTFCVRLLATIAEIYTEKCKTDISTQVSAYHIAHVLVFLQIVLFRHRFQSSLACKPIHKHAHLYNTWLAQENWMNVFSIWVFYFH